MTRVLNKEALIEDLTEMKEGVSLMTKALMKAYKDEIKKVTKLDDLSSLFGKDNTELPLTLELSHLESTLLSVLETYNNLAISIELLDMDAKEYEKSLKECDTNIEELMPYVRGDISKNLQMIKNDPEFSSPQGCDCENCSVKDKCKNSKSEEERLSEQKLSEDEIKEHIAQAVSEAFGGASVKVVDATDEDIKKIIRMGQGTKLN